MNEYYLVAVTPRSTINYRCLTKLVDISLVSKYSEKEKFDRLCKTGCPNYEKKWSCPPYAPAFEDFVSPFKYVEVIMLIVEMSEFDYIHQDYLKVKSANSILKSRIDKALRLSMNENEFYISTGSCRLCNPCKKKLGRGCAHTESRTFSFEALGINVSALTFELFQTNLLWYQKKMLPNYTCVVAGLLTNDNIYNDKVVVQLRELK